MNEKLSFIGIIPARYASTRFPGKPLAMLGGMTMIERVYRQVSKALDRVVVATDDDRIMAAVEAFGGKAVMTSTEHRSGTDRCQEAYLKNGGGENVIINIQGDEPFIQPDQLQAIMACFDDEGTDIATLVRPFNPNRPYSELENPNSPKVVLDSQMRARYFSRSVIPYIRGREREEWPKATQYYTHVGMYAYVCLSHRWNSPNHWSSCVGLKMAIPSRLVSPIPRPSASTRLRTFNVPKNTCATLINTTTPRRDPTLQHNETTLIYHNHLSINGIGGCFSAHRGTVDEPAGERNQPSAGTHVFFCL